MRPVVVTVYQVLIREYKKESEMIGEGSTYRRTAQAQMKFW